MSKPNLLRDFPVDLATALGFPMVPLLLLWVGFMSLGSASFGVWACVYCTMLGIACVGAALLAKAKWPLYREGRFFTFGIRHIREDLRTRYRWGIGLSLFAIIAALLVLMRCPVPS